MQNLIEGRVLTLAPARARMFAPGQAAAAAGVFTFAVVTSACGGAISGDQPDASRSSSSTTTVPHVDAASVVDAAKVAKMTTEERDYFNSLMNAIPTITGFRKLTSETFKYGTNSPWFRAAPRLAAAFADSVE